MTQFSFAGFYLWVFALTPNFMVNLADDLPRDTRIKVMAAVTLQVIEPALAVDSQPFKDARFQLSEDTLIWGGSRNTLKPADKFAMRKKRGYD